MPNNGYCTDNADNGPHLYRLIYMLFDSSWLVEVNLMFESSDLIFETKYMYTYIELLKLQASFGP